VQASLQIFDLSGNKVFASKLDPSLYQNKLIFDWNGKNTAGGQLPPGVYFTQLQLVKGKESLVLSSKLYKL
jgi:flagellar hook assembly protein FlgD